MLEIRIPLANTFTLPQSAGSLNSEEEAPYDTISGFVNGNFAAGKVRDIRLPEGCWVTAYSERADLLAVGLQNRIDFLETRNYTTVHSIECPGKVSAIQWAQGASLNPNTSLKNANNKLRDSYDGEIIAVSCLDGQVSVYQFDVDLLELQGVQLIHQFHVPGQVRCMAMRPLGHGKLALAVGDKSGIITLVTLVRSDTNEIDGSLAVVFDLEKDAVLGLDIHAEKSILVASTKSGKVMVYKLLMTKYKKETTYAIFGTRLWTTQRNGPVRDVIITRDGKQIAFGGYDKTLVLVDTKIYAVVRELYLGGTVRFHLFVHT